MSLWVLTSSVSASTIWTLALLAVHVDDDFLIGDALDLDGVPAGELEVRPVIAADVAVDDHIGGRGDADDDGFAGAGVLGDPADRAGGDHDLVLGRVPFGLPGDGVPEQFEAEAAPADEDILHLLRDGFGLDGVVRHVDVQGAVGIAFVYRLEGVFEFCQDLGLGHRITSLCD